MVATRPYPCHHRITVYEGEKHAYVEKPLTHNIYEARMMATVAKEQNIITQMGVEVLQVMAFVWLKKL